MFTCDLIKSTSRYVKESRAKRSRRVIGSLLAASLVYLPSFAAADEYRDRVYARVSDVTTQLEARINAGSVETVRDRSNAALGKLFIDHDPAAARRLLEQVFESQDMDPNSPTYGILPWEIGRNVIQDDNATVFGTQSWGAILLGYADQFDPEFVERFKDHARAALAAIRRQQVLVTYTNIYLMNTTNRLLIGLAVGDDDAVAEARTQLDLWKENVRTQGIYEFTAPTYYRVDAESLYLGQRYGGPASDTYRQILDFFNADALSSYFPGGQRLAGPRSRDNGFIDGSGTFQFYFLSALGLLPLIDTRVNEAGASLFANSLEPGGYQLPEAIRNYATLGEKTVVARWSTEPWSVRTTYITPDYAIGSTSGNYSPTDKPFALDLNGPALPQISLIADPYDSPWGNVKPANATTGQIKPRHAYLALGSVQYKNTVLGVTDARPSGEKGAQTFAINLIMPRNVDEIRIGDTPYTDTAVPLTLPGKVGLRNGNTCVAFSFRSYEPTTSVVAKSDSYARARGALRLALYYDPTRGYARAIMLAHVDTCPAGGLSEMMGALPDVKVDRLDQTITATAQVDGHKLMISNRRVPGATSSRGNEFIRTIDDAPPPEAVAQINGEDLLPLLDSVLPAEETAALHPRWRREVFEGTRRDDSREDDDDR